MPLNINLHANNADGSRILVAFGRIMFPGENRDATPAEVQAKVVEFIVGNVRLYEHDVLKSTLVLPGDVTIT